MTAGCRHEGATLVIGVMACVWTLTILLGIVAVLMWRP